MIALSTATKKAMIAIKFDGKEDFCQLDANAKHSENALPALIELLEKNEIELKDNDSFAVVVGPGSFTGIRIGLALVKGLVEGLGQEKRVFSLSTFELMATAYLKQKPTSDFMCVIDALSGLCFACKFDKDGKQIGKEELLSKEELDKIEVQKVSLKEENIYATLVDVSASDLLDLALEKEKQGQSISQKELTALYIRKSQAEDQLKK